MKGQISGRKKEKKSFICWFSSQMATMAGAGLFQSQYEDLHLGLLWKWQGPKLLGHLLLLFPGHCQGTGLEVELLWHEQAHIWNAMTGDSFIHYITVWASETLKSVLLKDGSILHRIYLAGFCILAWDRTEQQFFFFSLRQIVYFQFIISPSISLSFSLSTLLSYTPGFGVKDCGLSPAICFASLTAMELTDRVS